MKLLNVKEVADALKISRPQVRKMIASGEIPAAMVGREYRISEKVLDTLLLEWMKQR